MHRKTLALVVASAVIIGVSSVVGSVDAGGLDATAVEFTAGITPGGSPDAIAAGSDGSMWFTEGRFDDQDSSTNGQIAKITPAGVVTEYGAGIGARLRPTDIVAGPDGNMWFTEFGTDEVFNGFEAIGRITPTGAITEFGITKNSRPIAITAGPDGNLWFTEGGRFGRQGLIGRITPAGVVTEFSDGLQPSADPADIVAGPDGNVWFLDNQGWIGRVDAGGKIREFPLGSDDGDLARLAAGADGNVWFTEIDSSGSSRIVRVPPDGTQKGFGAGITPGRFVTGITPGPDGNLWFVEETVDGIAGIGRITADGTITELAAPAAPGGDQTGIATGCDGNLWLTQPYTDRVVRFTPPASNATPKLPAACKASAKTAPTTTTTTTTSKPKKKKKSQRK